MAPHPGFRLALVAWLALAAPLVRADAVPGLEPPPASPARGGADAVLVTVRSVAIDGLAGGWVGENEVLDLEVKLYWDRRMQPAGWVAPPPGRAGQSLKLWTLGGFDRRGTQVYGSGLQAIVDAVAAFLRSRGMPDARVGLADTALRKLATPGSDGLLLLDVSSARAGAAASD